MWNEWIKHNSFLTIIILVVRIQLKYMQFMFVNVFNKTGVMDFSLLFQENVYPFCLETLLSTLATINHEEV